MYLQEPGRFRAPRDRFEEDAVAEAAARSALFPEQYKRRVLLTHMRAEVARGHLWPILGDARNNRVLGYRNQGGTLNEAGLLFANRANWASVLEASAQLLNLPLGDLLAEHERAALAGNGDPACLY